MRYIDIDTEKPISKIGLGTWQFGADEWGYGDQYAHHEADAIVRRAVELGVTLFDTAEIYSSGRSERILGPALADNLDKVVVATKLFPLLPGGPMVERRARASAQRLGAPCLDLYQVHFPNPLVPDRAVMRHMRRLQDAGLVGEVGVSGYSVERWRTAEEALGSPIRTNQVAYNLLDRSPERDLIPFAESHHGAILAHSPLAKGLLSGSYSADNPPQNPVRRADPLFQSDNLHSIHDLMVLLREVADAHRETPAQISLAWVIHRPEVAAIPGASSVAQLESNVAAAEIQLADDEYQALHAVASRLFPLNVSQPSLRHTLSAVKHSALGGKYLAGTLWNDRKSARRRGLGTVSD